MITTDRAARRYLQARETDRLMQDCDKAIHDKQGQINALKEELSTLRATKSSLQGDLMKAVRDQGELPLIDLMEELNGEAVAAAKKH